MEMEKFGHHGGNVHKISKKLGIRKTDILDFSANINPLGIPDSFKEYMVSNIDDLTMYPDPESTDLRDNISKYIDVPVENLIVGNGASEIIYLLFETLRSKKVLIAAPTFSEYASAANRYGAQVDYFELKESHGFKLDVEGLIEYMDASEPKIDAVVICNPNNPTSTLTPKSQMTRILEFTNENDIMLIVDEAFMELTIDGDLNSMSGYVAEYTNLFVVRALTKIFAIPGLRIGYGVGSKGIISDMLCKKVPWSVNSLASNGGGVLLDDSDYLNRTKVWLKEEMEWLYHELVKIESLKVYKPETNFILIRIIKENLSSSELLESMATENVIIRDAGNFKYLDDTFFRIAIKDRKSNEEFMRVLREFVV